MKHAWPFVALLAALGMAACRAEPTSSSVAGSDKAYLSVIASIPPLAMIAAEIGGSRVAASSLLAAGASPPTFEARAKACRAKRCRAS